MEKVAQIWHWLTTSRYTRALEAENVRSFMEIAELKASNKRLMAAVMPTLKAAITGESEKQSTAEGLPHATGSLKAKRNGWSSIKSSLERDYAAEKSAHVVETNMAVPGV